MAGVALGRHAPSLCLAGVAGVALGDMYLHLVTSTLTLRGRRGGRGAYGTGDAPGSQMTPWSPRLFAWQAWHLVTWMTWILTLRGRRGTWRHGPSLCVAGVALTRRGSQMTPWPPRLFAWQAWHLVTWMTWILTLRGRRGTWRHGPLLCVAGVALGDMYLHLVTSTLTLRGRRGTYGTGPALVTGRVPK